MPQLNYNKTINLFQFNSLWLIQIYLQAKFSNQETSTLIPPSLDD